MGIKEAQLSTIVNTVVLCIFYQQTVALHANQWMKSSFSAFLYVLPSLSFKNKTEFGGQISKTII